jgi:hypothetical protein
MRHLAPEAMGEMLWFTTKNTQNTLVNSYDAWLLKRTGLGFIGFYAFEDYIARVYQKRGGTHP